MVAVAHARRGGRSGSVIDKAVLETLEQRQLLSTVAGAYLFYNNSAFDGNDAAITVADDASVATDKQPLRELQQASFANYSSYSRGLNGLMVDIDQPSGVPTLDDFIFRAGNDLGDPFAWSDASRPTGFAVRPGDGKNGSTRCVFTWDDASAVKGKWLQVTVLPDDRTGLDARDTFYFGSAVGETGNIPGSTRVDGADQLAIRANPRNLLNPAVVDNPYDINRDRKVDGTDQLISRSFPTNYATELRLITASANPVTAIEADVYSPSELRLTWREHSGQEAAYSVQVAGADGSLAELKRVPANATACLLTDLAAGTTYRFRVIPLDVAGQPLSGATSPVLVVQTQERLTTDTPQKKWYVVSLPSSSMTKGEAGYTLVSSSASVSPSDGLVYAESPEAAAWLAISGTATIKNYADEPHDFSTSTSGCYAVGKVGDLAGIHSGYDKCGMSDDQYVITLEDTWNWNSIDYDYDDFYWKVGVTSLTVAGVTLEGADGTMLDGIEGKAGLRVFADKESPTDTVDHRRIRVRASLASPTPGVTVYFRLFDVDDASSDGAVDPNGAAGGDNRGSSGQLAASAVTDQNGEAELVFSVSAQPGDNYRVGASLDQPELTALGQDSVPAGDAQVDSLMQGCLSPLLTVWRRLWVELDSMRAATGGSTQATVKLAPQAQNGSLQSLTIQLNVAGYQSGDIHAFEGGYVYFPQVLRFAQILSVADYPAAAGFWATLQLAPGDLPAEELAHITVGDIVWIHDDDDDTLLPRTLPLDPIATSAFAEAYVSLETVPASINTTTEVDFVRNLGTGSQQGVLSSARNTTSSSDFWCVDVIAAFEPEASLDGDPDLYGPDGQPTRTIYENYILGRTAVGASENNTCAIFVEAIRDSAVDRGVPLDRALSAIMAHEIAHSARDGGNASHTTGLMAAMPDLSAATLSFDGAYLAWIRGVTTW